MAKILRAEPLSSACTSRRFIELVGNKWTLLILLALRGGPKRNGGLMRDVEGVSQKMLTQTLRLLIANGLVVRRDMHAVPPHVEYRLTELGRSLDGFLRSLDQWFEDHLEAFGEVRGAIV